MPPILDVAGPAHIYVGPGAGPAGSPGGGGGMQYLGTAERSPLIEILPEYYQVFADSTARRVPFDELWGGEHALIRADLTRFDAAVYLDAAGKAGHLAGIIRSQGAFIRLEGYALQVAVNFEFGGGYLFPACSLVNPERLDDLGTMVRKLGVVFHALPDEEDTLYEASDSGDMGLPNPQ
jgi:hypothetical protein